MEHLETCAQLRATQCPANKSIFNEQPTEHWWSGWPGAYCLKCHQEDKNEICIADDCHCNCHKELWNSYASYCSFERWMERLRLDAVRYEIPSPDAYIDIIPWRKLYEAGLTVSQAIKWIPGDGETVEEAKERIGALWNELTDQ